MSTPPDLDAIEALADRAWKQSNREAPLELVGQVRALVAYARNLETEVYRLHEGRLQLTSRRIMRETVERVTNELTARAEAAEAAEAALERAKSQAKEGHRVIRGVRGLLQKCSLYGSVPCDDLDALLDDDEGDE